MILVAVIVVVGVHYRLTSCFVEEFSRTFSVEVEVRILADWQSDYRVVYSQWR